MLNWLSHLISKTLVYPHFLFCSLTTLTLVNLDCLFRYSIVNELQYHRPVSDHVIEPLHNLLLGKLIHTTVTFHEHTAAGSMSLTPETCLVFVISRSSLVSLFAIQFMSYVWPGVAKRVFTTLVDNKVISAKRLAEKLSGILPSGLIGRLSREFSWFTAADWLEFTVTGAVYGCNGEVDRETQNIVEKLRDSLDLLLRR